MQHHPARRARLPQLLHHLAPLTAEVVEHHSDPPDPWTGYKRCLTAIPYCTHLLIVQDDALPVPGFTEALPLIAQAHPDRPVCLWMSYAPAAASLRARRAIGKQVYIPLGPAPFVPLVAVLWPKTVAERLLVWAQRTRTLTRADDGNIARWARQAKIEFMVTVPSIVEHDDFAPTVKGGRPETQGRDRTRVACLLADDATRYGWLPSDRPV